MSSDKYPLENSRFCLCLPAWQFWNDENKMAMAAFHLTNLTFFLQLHVYLFTNLTFFSEFTSYISDFFFRFVSLWILSLHLAVLFLQLFISQFWLFSDNFEFLGLFFSFLISKLWEIAITFFFASLWKQASVILLFSEYALRQSTLTIKAFIMLQNIYISNKCCVLNFLFGKESCKQMYFNFHGNIKQHNIDNNKKCFLCSRSVY